jgi:hypothetical protein
MTTTTQAARQSQQKTSSPNRTVRSASDVDEKAQSERVWQEIHSVLRNSQPDEPVTEWADASIDFRIGDSSPSLIRTVSAEDNMLRHVSRSSSTSSTSSAASAPVAVARRLHVGSERSSVASSKTNIPHADMYAIYFCFLLSFRCAMSICGILLLCCSLFFFFFFFLGFCACFASFSLQLLAIRSKIGRRAHSCMFGW